MLHNFLLLLDLIEIFLEIIFSEGKHKTRCKQIKINVLRLLKCVLEDFKYNQKHQIKGAQRSEKRRNARKILWENEFRPNEF